MKTSRFAALIVGLALARATPEAGQLVRPKPSERTESKCSQDLWDSIAEMERYNNWTVQDLTRASGFTVAITQWNSVVSSQCLQTVFEISDNLLAVSHVHPTQPLKTSYYNIADGTNATETTTTRPIEDAPKMMIAGASRNFAVYVMCNEQSSNLNLYVTYGSAITNDEKKTINTWIKASSFPIIGRWGAVNFDTCFLTKTYVCNGGRTQFCSGINRKSKQGSSEERDDTMEIIDLFG
ncbi:uncharacterized protein LOC100900295 [Galendromus occidentalis]|uniref:Uncharacterized protein LOC100900295 n=1 Tax=Galendromus occidentalis TaxID=34638 RepID=A0AAJ6QPM1_9ACAR|nr:uncharacterized protein LOC100900295 [Galendromus occidentalis]